MAYKKGENRFQRILFPDCIDEYVEADAPVRLFDAFVDNLDIATLEFVRSAPAETGTPGYDPRDLLKLYIYGYFYQVRSSRRLARECRCNIEVMWMLGKLAPDFRTISDFRKDNREALEKVFKQFNKFCMEIRLFSKSYISIDGSKFKAVNAKDNNFTLNKLDDRIKRLDEHIAIYLEELESCDHEEGRKLSRDELRQKLTVCEERKERYIKYRTHLEESGESQISLTDPDAKLMKTNEGFCVGYNVQTAVDAESHLIAGYNVTNAPTDHGQLTEVAVGVKEEYGVDILESVADKGYESPDDQVNALISGIVPNVCRRDGGCESNVEFDYIEQAISEEQKVSNKSDDLEACLRSGVIPEIYKDILSDAEIRDVRIRNSNITDSEVLKMSPEQMLEKALEGYFVRDAVRNLVYCPQGEILRQKSMKRNGNLRYCNKLACKRCKCKCTVSKFKEADFSKDTLIKAANIKGKQKDRVPKQKYKSSRSTNIKKIVRYTLHLDQKKMYNRKCLSEHPFGTIKRALGHYYFLLKGFAKVKAEVALFCLSCNLRRAINLKGVPALIAALK